MIVSEYDGPGATEAKRGPRGQLPAAVLHAHGGTGYDHVLVGVVPALRARGFSEDDVRTLLVDNPRRALTGRAW
ncbi:MAG: hypothetical protein WCS84_16125 [Nocardioides sp.]